VENFISEKDFALAVVSGNPVGGGSPEETARKALDLYLAAKKTVREHNEKVKQEADRKWTET